jgi:hypothetical protein
MTARSQARFGRIRVSPSCPNASAFICLLLVVIFAATGICSAQGAGGPVPRVLILYPYDERIPATNIVGETARTRLVEATSGKVEVFSEFFDLSRFAKKRHVDRIARYLAEKYSDGRPDLVIALGEESTSSPWVRNQPVSLLRTEMQSRRMRKSSSAVSAMPLPRSCACQVTSWAH